MGSGFAKMKKQARLMQQQYAEQQEQLKSKLVTGKSEGDLITITLNGEGQMQSIKIQPQCVDVNDLEGLEDLIRSAFENARKQLDEESPDLSKMFPGL